MKLVEFRKGEMLILPDRRKYGSRGLVEAQRTVGGVMLRAKTPFRYPTTGVRKTARVELRFPYVGKRGISLGAVLFQPESWTPKWR